MAVCMAQVAVMRMHRDGCEADVWLTLRFLAKLLINVFEADVFRVSLSKPKGSAYLFIRFHQLHVLVEGSLTAVLIRGV